MSSYPPPRPVSHPVYRQQQVRPYSTVHPSDLASQTVIRISPRTRKKIPLASLILLAIVGSALVLFLLTLAGALSVYAYYQVSARILPGVHVGGTQLGSMTLEEAEIALEEKWNLETQVLVTNGLQRQSVPPADLGLHLDSAQTAQKAHNVGHGGSFLAETAQLFASMKDGMEVKPVVILDVEVARAGLEAIAPLMSQPAKDASLRVEGGTLVPIPPEVGYTINIEEALKMLEANPQEILVNGALQVTPQPVLPSILDVTPVMAEAQRLLDTPLNIQGYDPVANEWLNWPVPREVVGTWLKVEAGYQGPQVALDEAQAAIYLAGLSESLGPERYLEATRESTALAEAMSKGSPLSVTISHRPITYLVQPDDTMLKISWRAGMPMWMILEANPTVNPEAVQAGTELIIPSKDRLLPLPVVPNKRIVISLSKQRLWAYQDNSVLNKYIISTGIDSSPTQPGIFQVQSHELNAYASVWDLYMPHFLGVYEAWPGFMNGIHGLPTLSSGRRLWADILGSPASYGCIILDLGAAEWLYSWAEDGVVVEIQP